MYKIIKGEFREGRVEGRAVFLFCFVFFILFLWLQQVLEPRYQTTQQTRQNGHKLDKTAGMLHKRKLK